MRKTDFLGGVWSAAPTPYTVNGQIDKASIARMTEHHLRLGVKGVFVCGTCGEGPWLTDSMRNEAVKETVRSVAGRMKVTVQVTDNSAARVLDNISRMRDSGVDAAVIAAPYFMIKPAPEYMREQILQVLDKSPLPVGFYHRGKSSTVPIAVQTISELMSHPNLVMIKDSSANNDDMKLLALTANKIDNPPLLLNGDEFDLISYMQAGYDGALIGSGCFCGHIANKIIEAVRDGKIASAKELQERMNSLMYDVWGGKSYACWLAGQKQLMVELGIFSFNNTLLDFHLNNECHKAIKRAIERDHAFLLP